MDGRSALVQITITLFVTTFTLGKGLGGYRAADTILDGDGLYGGRVTQRERCAVEGALSSGCAAVRGVVDLSTSRSGDAHLGGLLYERMSIKELSALSESQVKDVLALMSELDPEINVSSAMLHRAVESSSSHFFAITDTDDHITSPDNHIIGCATLCVFESPTGRKASVEDVVVSSQYRGQGLGKMLMEHVIEYAKTELKDVDIHLTSRPHRVAANKLYQQLGFQQKQTNVYVMKVREGEA